MKNVTDHPSTLYSILTVRCPRCHEGKMFPEHTLYHPLKFMKMNEQCARCGQSFEPEPGYYFGAMFITYAINAGLFIAVWLLLLMVSDTITVTMLTTILMTIVIGLLPLTYRWSRVMWISIFIRYRGLAEE